MELGLYFMVNTGQETRFVSDVEDLQWILLDYPKETADCYTKHHHTLLYERKPLHELTRKAPVTKEQLNYRRQLV